MSLCYNRFDLWDFDPLYSIIIDEIYPDGIYRGDYNIMTSKDLRQHKILVGYNLPCRNM